MCHAELNFKQKMMNSKTEHSQQQTPELGIYYKVLEPRIHELLLEPLLKK